MKEAKNELSIIRHQRSSKEREISREEEYHRAFIKNNAKTTKAGDLQARAAHSTFIRHKINKLNHEKEQIIEIENLRRPRLNEAMKEEKVLSKLKEKQQVRHKEETEREERKNLDEIAQKHYGNNQFKSDFKEK